ncbi:MAG: hypothetical protein MUF49_27265 [Oculatellaceae cyanobacterium Prado106]|jgi:hypothetical protein|nr:hypothetical protein [Oculatellaceae cyanobacterium Prado106]
MSIPRHDSDSPWNLLLRQSFPDAIAFFFPDTARLIDWQHPIEFLDGDLRQVQERTWAAIGGYGDQRVGERAIADPMIDPMIDPMDDPMTTPMPNPSVADHLVKVSRKHGKDMVLFLHVNLQPSPEAKLAERMLIHHLAIFDLLCHPAISLAILGDENPHWRPSSYGFESADTRLNFEFGMVKLLDYRLQWPTLERSRNLFAMAVMAHLKLQETQQNAHQRKIWKSWLIHRLSQSRYSQQENLSLLQFIDRLLILPEPLQQELWVELEAGEGNPTAQTKT